ncbi:TonB-dependent receptor plug domain-containing protein [Aquimarina sp. TRL1]|uniref:TonB-dependent receptor domain-containing protein n=1 Tax=Aquimarina sp. (strain TRL1) TaxID=2736252 RepID=UPI00158A6405|nr:TonB-dependent receptor [Aquimarina sp. TRL1]QKX03662.1 TonB-dependent receptor plug domain-containing protein [Aquimarina sp. TRL1]
MKKITILFTFCISTFIAISQENKKISIEFTDTPLQEALLELERQIHQKFFFEENWLKSYKVTKKYHQETIKNVLKGIFEETNINFYFTDDRIILLNNSIIYAKLPESFFEEKEQNQKLEEKDNIPIFQQAYVTTSVSRKNKLVTIGKQQLNISKKTFELSGVIQDFKTNKPIPNVSIHTTDKLKYAITDKNGRYRIQLPYGYNKLETNILGYEKLYQEVILYGTGTLNLKILQNAEALDEVVIESKKDANVKDAVVGANQIKVKEIKTIPLVLGERDVLKVATTLPGIKTVGEGANGFNVRGGRADQNLILLDDAVMYNPSHFLGLFSAVNPFTTSSLDIFKASIPAEYGGRLSSVFNIKTKGGNTKKIAGEGSIGPVTGNLALEIPVVKEKASVIAGVRATYSDYILRNLDEEALKHSEASFYDGILKYKHTINNNNAVQATLYYSKDRFSITQDSLLTYSNRLGSVKWSHSFNDANRFDAILVNSEYKYNILHEGGGNQNFDFGYTLNETQLKFNFDYDHSEKHKISYGVSSKLYNIDPGRIFPVGEGSDIVPKTIASEKGLESALYISDLYKVNEKLLLDIGIRYSIYAALGASTQKKYAPGEPKNEGTVIEVRDYKSNEVIETYGNPEFRISGRYLLGNDFSIKAGYTSTAQYLHLLSTNTTMSPMDIWKLSDLNIAPQTANQFSLGVFKNIPDKDLEFSLEGYYKKMKDLLDYKVGAQLILNDNLETDLLQGEGKAYGVEFLAKKTKGRLNGHLGYSYSRSMIKLDSELDEERVNNGEFFPSNFDKPHDFSLVANYKITKRYSISTNFIYQTGRPVTYPIGKFTFAGQEQVLYSDRNQFRIPDYYRLDIGINIEGNHKRNKLAHSFVNISIYNVLGRNNPYSVFFVNKGGDIKAYKTTIFSVPIPTITYNFKF